MRGRCIVFTFTLIVVSTVKAQPANQLRVSDLLNAGKAMGQIAGEVAGNFVNMTEDVLTDMSQFTIQMAKKYFDVFKVTNNKVYSTPEEEDRRFSIFFQNLFTILTHNKLFATAQVPFSLGITKFADITDEEFVRNVCNCLKEEQESKDIEVKNYLKFTEEVPSEKDWRKLGAVTPVKEQDTCGSCWTFAAAGAIEAAQYLATNELKNVSMQNMLDCSGDGNCKGGHYAIGFQYAIKNNGLNLLSDYPYENAKKTCRYNARKPTEGKIKKFFKVPADDEEELKKAVAFHGPVAVGINSKGLKLFKSSGVYYDLKTCGRKSRPDHAVLVVGYGTTPEKEDYWIVKNSWGPNWGDDGYFKLARNKNNHCHVAHDGVYPIF